MTNLAHPVLLWQATSSEPGEPMLDLFTSLDDYGNTLHVRVTPKSSSNRIKVEEAPDGTKLVRVYVTTVPEDGKANAQVIKLLSKALNLPKSAFTITQGLKGRNKTILIKR
jgi:uncharacterized protein YggU (UPF0235/DUF167 family)